MSEQLRIRAATSDDVDELFSLICALADYERAPDAVTGSPALLHTALFGPAPCAEAVLAETGGDAVGYAIFHGTFSTWECLPGIWLEDLFVVPQRRRDGIGETLFRHVARIAVDRGCTRLGWQVLDWNTSAISFYEKLGAELLGEWELVRLSGLDLVQVARAPAGPVSSD